MTHKLILALVFGAVAAGPAFAQTTQATPQRPASGFDSRWTPYLGCWRIVQEHLGDQTVPVAPGLMVCARPSGPSGVAITTTVDGKNVLEQTIVANGLPEPVSQADCQGAQTSEWSRDGERLFTRVELECAGRPKRVVSGITQIAKGHWVDAQATVIDGNHDVRLRRYRRTSDQVTGGAAAAGTATSPLSIEDVIEANGKVLSSALEAALVEAGGRFTLNSRTLEQLAHAGVSPNVIDLMVAQAFPDRFQIERPSNYPTSLAGNTWSSSNTSMMIGSAAYPYAMYDPFYSSYYYYSPFAYPYYWGSSYSPYRSYGYGNRNYNNYYYGGSGGTIYLPGNPGSAEGGTAQPGSPNSPGGDGVVVKGRGYTRVRPSSDSGDSGGSAAPTQRSAPSGRGARTVDSGSESSNSGSSSGSSSSGSSSGSPSSSGASSGGGGNSGGGGGRTAQPR